MKHFILILALLLSSCISSQYTPVNQFDFKEISSSNNDIYVDQISLEGPYSSKVVYRSGFSLIEDEFNRWCEKPEKMFSRNWKIAFNEGGNKKLSGTIRRFDFDLDTNEACIIFDLKINNQHSRYTVKEKFSGTAITDKVKAMNKAFKSLTDKIEKKL